MNNLEILTPSQHAHTHHGTRQKHKCIVCGKITINRKVCSNKCNSLNQRKCKRPSKALLEALLLEYPYVTVGKMFGVSDNAIRKWQKEV